jgi:hypothetical protein
MDPVTEYRYLCWVGGDPTFVATADRLFDWADAHGQQVFVAWEFDWQGAQVLKLVAQRLESGWQFIDEEGKVRPKVGTRTLTDWVVETIAGWTPMQGTPVARETWEALPVGAPLYQPFGWGLPIRLGQGGWAYSYCPELIAEQIAQLDDTDRYQYLQAMYARLVWWTELANDPLEPDVREGMLDKRLMDAAPDSWRVINRIQTLR